MYQIANEAYEEVIGRETRTFFARMTFDSGTIDSSIRQVTAVGGSCGADVFIAGAAFAGYANILLVDPEIEVADREFLLEIGLQMDDGSVEYVPIGRYTAKAEDCSKTKHTVTLTAWDRMSRGSIQYVPQVLYPCTAGEILDDISAQTGLTFDISRLPGIRDEQELSFPEDYLINTVIGFIAGLKGGFAYAGRDGRIILAPYPSVSSFQLAAGRFLDEILLADYPVSMDAGGDATDYTFYPGVIRFLGDPRLDPEDMLSVIDTESQSRNIPCMSIQHIFDGGLVTIVSAPAKEDQSAIWGPIARRISAALLASEKAEEKADEAATAAESAQTAAGAAQTAAGEAQTAAENALTTANGKNKIFYQDAEPSAGMNKGDLWFDTDGGNAVYEYTTSGWVLRQFGHGAIAANSVTAVEINVSTLSAISAYLGSAIIGGANNQNGTLTIKDASNNTIGYWNNTGINAQAGKIGPWVITDNAIYHNLKSSLSSVQPGTYIGTDGISGCSTTGDGWYYLTPTGELFLEDDSTSTTSTTAGVTVLKATDHTYAYVTPYHVSLIRQGNLASADMGIYSNNNGYLAIGNGTYNAVYLGADGSVTTYDPSSGTRRWYVEQSTMEFFSASDSALIKNRYGTADYNLIRNHGNGNISISASSAGLYFGYENTTFVNFLNGKMSLNSSGELYVTSNIVLNTNVSYLYGKYADDNNRILCGVDNNDAYFGYGGYAASVGSSYFDGNSVYIRSKGNIYLQSTSLVASDHLIRVGSAAADTLFTDVGVGSLTVRYGTYNALQMIADANGQVRLWRRRADNSSFNLISCANNSNAVTTGGDWTFRDYSGTNRRPVCSASTDGGRVAFLAMNGATSLGISAQSGTAGGAYVTHAVTVSSSDIRLKEHIEDTNVTALDALNAIRLRSFDWKSDHDHWKIGMIADEVEKIDPKFAVGGGEEDGVMNVKSIDTFYMMGYVIKAIQELTAENKSLKKKITSLERKCA